MPGTPAFRRRRTGRSVGRRHFCRSIACGSAWCAAALTAGCSPARILNAVVPDSGYRVAKDQAYAAGPRRKLDVYVPDGATAPVPVVVFIYGGDWRSGDKSMYRFVGQAMAARGVAVAIPDYRLYPEVRFPDFLKDNAAAAARVVAHANAFELDRERLYLMGHSAGAYNAAMLAVDRQWLAGVGLDPRRDVRGFVGLAGPYDFLPLDQDTEPIFGAAPDIRKTQPVDLVTGHEPPMLLATGLADTTVRPRNTLSLAAAVRRHGGRVEVRTYADVGHVQLVADLAAPLQTPRVPVLEDTLQFFGSTR